jgi:hypothetical protein
VNSLRKLLALAAALGMSALVAGPAIAQGWQDRYYDGPSPGWNDPYYRTQDWGPYGRDGYRPYADGDYGFDTGIRDIAVCPPGYHLGRSPGLCWPDR